MSFVSNVRRGAEGLFLRVFDTYGNTRVMRMAGRQAGQLAGQAGQLAGQAGQLAGQAGQLAGHASHFAGQASQLAGQVTSGLPGAGGRASAAVAGLMGKNGRFQRAETREAQIAGGRAGNGRVKDTAQIKDIVR